MGRHVYALKIGSMRAFTSITGGGTSGSSGSGGAGSGFLAFGGGGAGFPASPNRYAAYAAGFAAGFAAAFDGDGAVMAQWGCSVGVAVSSEGGKIWLRRVGDSLFVCCV